ncbi:C-24(28) sterol reductase [Exophiala xenobiotica]|nr:C-24(28) sterol reductase [Exophiala xenobiotica]KAK5297611.1 C-24(28) sterol reductase [Exophiala xenobiotica]KAK5485577.1 C-24(28) sterol reductase [Exophiala xenobiotica]
MTVTRTQAGKTPRKTSHPGYVETPGTFRKPRTRKSMAALGDSDAQDSSTGLEDDAPVVKRAPRSTRKTSRSLRATDGAADTSDEERMNGHTNGHANGHANGVVKGTANGSAKKEATDHPVSTDKVIDGWRVGTDPKVDTTGHFEFGGPWGVTAMMIGFPLLMYYMWIGATYYDGKFPAPRDDENMTEFLRGLVRMAYYGAWPSAKPWAMYWTFFIFEGALYCLMPGIWTKGKPLPHENGQRLDYYCSGMWSWWTTIVVALALHFSGIFKLYNIIDEFGPLMSVAILSGFLVSILAYTSALYRGKEHRMTGYTMYDFFMGAELNPRMFGILDFKMFFEVRLPWYILFLITLGTAARQYELYGYVSGEIGLLLMAHFLYANACSKGEECIVPTWDMYYEKWGFMLIFWNLAGVPLTYIHCTVYLANHHPSTYTWNKYALAVLYLAYLFVYWVWDTTNSQKNRFRAKESGGAITRKAFPQLPWQSVENPRVIRSEDGGTILADGWYAYARKIHYSCDLFFALSWAAVTGFQSPFPWFYPVFFTCMIIHRAIRDIQKCRRKYGKAWEEYERQVPYLFIPYVF